MKNSDYWKERMRILEAARNASNVRLVHRLEIEMNAALSEIDDRISGWYRRLSENNEVTISDAKRLLRDKELKEFRWTVEEYIRHGEENGIRKNWAKELENASARVHINHLEALKIELRGILEQFGGVQENSTKAHLTEQYADTVYKTMFEVQNGMGVYWNTGKVSREQIETVLSRPWTADERTFSDRIWMDKDALIDEVYKQLTRSVLLGKGPNDVVKAIAKRCQASQYNAGRLVFTESAYIAAEADKQVYKELSVEQFEVDAALDGETCALCGEMDGKRFPMSEYQPGLNAPPFHPNCRCTTVPYFDDDIQERLDKKVGRAARNSGTGKTERVENITYPEWKEKYVDNDRDSGIIKVTKPMSEVPDVHYIGKIDKKIYSCVTKDIRTDKVIITDTQIRHIKERHPNDYENYFKYAEEILKCPDYILEANKPNTAFILKHIEDNDKHYEMILRLQTSSDPDGYKNSIITFLKVEEKRYKRYIRTKKILYKSE